MTGANGKRGDVIGTLTAVLSALLLSELAFDPRDAAYWRRWLGWFGYTWRRLLLALAPAVVALAASQVAPGTAPVGQQILHGAIAGVTAAALLRADPQRRVRPGRGAAGPDQARAASALSWISQRACQRFDTLARRRIVAYLAELKVAGPGYPDNLLVTAEEIAGALGQDRGSAPARSRKAIEQKLDQVREYMDVLCDPLANERQCQAAAFALSELVAHEMMIRRWDRRPAFQPSRGGRWTTTLRRRNSLQTAP
jgi:hypothetical protein